MTAIPNKRQQKKISKSGREWGQKYIAVNFTITSLWETDP